MGNSEFPASAEEEVNQKDKPDSRLVLHIPDEEKGFANSTILVSWSTSPDFLEELKRRKFTNPHIVLVVRSRRDTSQYGQTIDDWRQDWVYVTKLSARATFVNFSRSGINEIRAVIVDSDSKDAASQIRDIVEKKRYNKSDIFDSDGKMIAKFYRYATLSSFIRREVPVEMFARKPSKHAENLVRRFYPHKEIDQCDFRKRFGLSLIWALLLVTIGQIIRLGSFIAAAFFGQISPHWREWRHPFNGRLRGPLVDVDYCLWTVAIDDEDVRFIPLLVFNPVVLLAPAAIIYAIMQGFAHGQHHGTKPWTKTYQLSYPGWWTTLWHTDAWIIGICLVVAAIIGVIIGISAINDWARSRSRPFKGFEDKVMAKVIATFKAFDKRDQRRREERLKELVVTDDKSTGAITSIYDLAPDQLTLKLRFYNVKSKVCRPFAR